jgi:ribosomal protein L7/L12
MKIISITKVVYENYDLTDGQYFAAQQFILAKLKVIAIKYIRMELGIELLEAKKIVETIEVIPESA